MVEIDSINNFMKKKLFINDTLQITMGRLLFVLLITMFQFLGIWAENNWVICPSMFFLFANMFLALGKSTKPAEEKKARLKLEREELARNNRSLIMTLNAEIYNLKKRLKINGE